ncbi:MAG: hypothetical protein H7A33_00355 [Deltaproteobacteria bacterium]|nr:hypothetical protein [Deltaproteobacteria bacterium]
MAGMTNPYPGLAAVASMAGFPLGPIGMGGAHSVASRVLGLGSRSRAIASGFELAETKLNQIIDCVGGPVSPATKRLYDYRKQILGY